MESDHHLQHNNGTENPNDNRNGNDGTLEDSSNKRPALAGQWRTPPLPVFASGGNNNTSNDPSAVATHHGPPHAQQEAAAHIPHPATGAAHHPHSTATYMPPAPEHVVLASSHMGTRGGGGGGSAASATKSSSPRRAPLPNPSQLPDNSEEYAKALQEAYRRGAEAAAAMVHHQHPPPAGGGGAAGGTAGSSAASSTASPPMPAAVSCPNLEHHNKNHRGAAAAAAAAVTAAASANSAPSNKSAPATNSNNLAPTTILPHSSPTASVLAPHPSSMPPISMTAAAAAAAPPPTGHHAHHPHQHPVAHHPGPHPPFPSAGSAAAASPARSMSMTAAPPAAASTAASPAATNASAAAAAAAAAAHAMVHRSQSLPEMNSYAMAQAEEEKRQKRLARNRASARLRRLRKKTLVDAYESEVGILESTLSQLKQHEWGSAEPMDTSDSSKQDEPHAALIQALGMERGQQAISQEQRAMWITNLLQQQEEFIQLLQDNALEQQILTMAAMEDHNDPHGTSPERQALLQEVQDVLQLTPTQKQALQQQQHTDDADVLAALETISQSLQLLKENDWLIHQGVQTITNQFTSLLHKNQLSKFLLWTDANAEAIDQLNHVQASTSAPDATSPARTSPMETTSSSTQSKQPPIIFTFGVDAAPEQDDDK